MTVQLIDAFGNRCIWAQRYDRAVADIFAVQDEIVASTVASVDAEESGMTRASVQHARAAQRTRRLGAVPSRPAWHVYRFTRDDGNPGRRTALRAGARAGARLRRFRIAGPRLRRLRQGDLVFRRRSKPAIAAGLAHAEQAISLDGDSASHRPFRDRPACPKPPWRRSSRRALHHLALAGRN